MVRRGTTFPEKLEQNAPVKAQWVGINLLPKKQAPGDADGGDSLV